MEISKIYQKKNKKKTVSGKVLRDEGFKIASIPKYDGYQRGLASVVYKYFDKKARDNVSCTGTGISENQELGNELKRYVSRNLKKRKIYFSSRDNIRGTDLVYMQLLSKCKMGEKFVLFFIDIFFI